MAYDLLEVALLRAPQTSKRECAERMPSEFHRRVSPSEVDALSATTGNALTNSLVKVHVGQKGGKNTR